MNRFWNQLNRLHHWLLSPRTSKNSIYRTLYTALWIVAGLGAAWSYFTLHEEERLGFGGVIATLFWAATLLQQYFVYQDLHDIEEGKAKEYGPWIDMRLEIGIRYLIVVALLLGVGKIASAISPVTTAVCLEDVCAEGESSWLCDIFNPERLFILGSLFVFLFLAIWNGYALPVRLGSDSYRAAVASAVARVDRLREKFINVRIFLFGVSAALCFGYWCFIAAGNTVFQQEFAKLWFLFYIFTFIFVALERFELTREWLIGIWMKLTD